MSHDPGDEDDGTKPEPTGPFATTETMDRAARKFIENYFGKRDDETLGEAMQRLAEMPNGALEALEAFTKAVRK